MAAMRSLCLLLVVASLAASADLQQKLKDLQKQEKLWKGHLQSSAGYTFAGHGSVNYFFPKDERAGQICFVHAKAELLRRTPRHVLGGDEASRSPNKLGSHLLGEDDASLSPFPRKKPLLGEDEASRSPTPRKHLLGEDDASRSPFPSKNLLGGDKASRSPSPRKHLLGGDKASRSPSPRKHLLGEDDASRSPFPKKQPVLGQDKQSRSPVPRTQQLLGEDQASRPPVPLSQLFGGDKAALPPKFDYKTMQVLPIKSIFQLIRSILKHNLCHVEARYHPKLGHPTRVNISECKRGPRFGLQIVPFQVSLLASLTHLKHCSGKKPYLQPKPIAMKLDKAMRTKNVSAQHLAAATFFQSLLPGPVIPMLHAHAQPSKPQLMVEPKPFVHRTPLDKKNHGPLIGGEPAVVSGNIKSLVPHRTPIDSKHRGPLIGGEPAVIGGEIAPKTGKSHADHAQKHHHSKPSGHHNGQQHHAGKQQHHHKKSFREFWSEAELKVRNFLRSKPWLLPVTITLLVMMTCAMAVHTIMRYRRRAALQSKDDYKKLVVDVQEKVGLDDEPQLFVNEACA